MGAPLQFKLTRMASSSTRRGSSTWATALTEPVRKEFNLSDTQIGAVTTAFTLLYALIVVPLGRVVDQWSRKRSVIGTRICRLSLSMRHG